MRHLYLSIGLCLAVLTATAQQSKKDIRADINLAGSNYVAYYGPTKRLTKAPKGYEPFYISHYGRHGSRYLIGTYDYDSPYRTLLKADSAGVLTAQGKAVLGKVGRIREEARQRDGELTLLGAQQHRGIAKRMMERFPEVFAGKTHVDARSTVVIRCILSMENELLQLFSMNPQLDILHDASEHDMWYLNDSRSKYNRLRDTKEAREALGEFNSRHIGYGHLMSVLFTDTAYVNHNIRPNSLGDHLAKLAANVQSTEIRHQLSLWDIFSEDEVYNFWLRNNAYWYTYYGPCRGNRGAGMYNQSYLLRNIIETADTCVGKRHPGATLRFGHEVCVMPLVCLLNLNGYGQTIDNLEDLDDRGWYNYRIFPMGCNVQFVFYRPVGEETKKDKRGAKHETQGKAGLDEAGDVLVKVLLNEDEATLPDLKPVTGPYYKWTDVRRFYLDKLDKAERELN